MPKAKKPRATRKSKAKAAPKPTPEPTPEPKPKLMPLGLVPKPAPAPEPAPEVQPEAPSVEEEKPEAITWDLARKQYKALSNTIAVLRKDGSKAMRGLAEQVSGALAIVNVACSEAKQTVKLEAEHAAGLKA